MKLITKNISADIYDYLDIGKTYKIMMFEREYPVRGFWNRFNALGKKSYVLLELWAEEISEMSEKEKNVPKGAPGGTWCNICKKSMCRNITHKTEKTNEVKNEDNN